MRLSGHADSTVLRVSLADCPLVGYQRLAIKVIQLAFRDLECGSPDLRQTARIFLKGHPLLYLWCDLAGVGAARVMAKATRAQAPWPLQGAGAEPGQAADGPKLATARASVS